MDARTLGTMMDTPLTLDVLVRRARDRFRAVEVVSRKSDKSLHRSTYGAIAVRAEKLARALLTLGVQPGARVATLM